MAGNFSSHNKAPADVKRIGVYDTDGKRCGIVPLGRFKPPDRSKRLYTFGVISDAHIGYDGAADDFRSAIRYLAQDGDVAFICDCGDITGAGTLAGEEENFKDYAKIIEENAGGKKVYTVSGNHEQTKYYLQYDGEGENYGKYNHWYAQWMHEYAGRKAPTRNEDGTVKAVHLMETFQPREDVKDLFVLLDCFGYHHSSGYQAYPVTANPPEIAGWYEDTPEIASGTYYEICRCIKKAKMDGYRVFVIHHVPNSDTLPWEYDLIPTRYPYIPRSVFENTVVFSGHRHSKFTVSGAGLGYKDDHGYSAVHVPAVCDTRQGYIVDVYKDGIHLRGKNFSTGEDIAIATYWIDTTR